MYAADGNSTFYWKLLDGMPMVGPLVAFDRLPVVFVIVGGFVALVSFLGCCGACEDSVCFLCVVSLIHSFIHSFMVFKVDIRQNADEICSIK